jgi:creatinine amidohydrolase
MKTVQWEELTSGSLVEAAGQTGGVCLLPVGSLEKHAEHLPVGVHALCVAAARIEPAVVFPGQFLAAVSELKCHPGAVALPARLLLETWERLCEEISRNGFHKIVIVNGHGGNRYILPQLIFECLNQPKDFVLYLARVRNDPELSKRLLKTDYHAHACECETSIVMHLRRDLVEAEKIGMLDGTPQRDFDIGDVYSSVDWYSLHPTNYGGDARTSSAEKGKLLFEDRARRLAEMIAKIKRDARVPQLLEEFYTRTEDFRNADRP